MQTSPVIIFLVLFLVRNVVSSRRFVRNAEFSERIVGGYKINIEDVPYQVYMDVKKGDDYFVCGGSIISKTYILTAAHCLEDIDSLTLVTGTTDADSGGNEYFPSPSLFRIHPLYDSWTSDYDVALIYMPDGIKLNENTVKIIKLAKKGTALETGSKVLVTGWGLTSEDASDRSRFLKAVKVKIVSEAECTKAYKKLSTYSHFCAGVPNGGKDSCQGDSGGPAVLIDTGIQVGVTSNGYGCGRKKYPGRYTNIADPDVRDFIKSVSGV